VVNLAADRARSIRLGDPRSSAPSIPAKDARALETDARFLALRNHPSSSRWCRS
jgi:hypothetical protein